MDALLNAVREGRDASVIVRNRALTNAHRKFLRMREKAKANAS